MTISAGDLQRLFGVRLRSDVLEAVPRARKNGGVENCDVEGEAHSSVMLSLVSKTNSVLSLTGLGLSS